MKQKSLSQPNYFTLVVSKEGRTTKPKTPGEFAALRAFRSNQLHILSLSMLGPLIEKGYSIHPSCLLPSLNSRKSDRGKGLTSYYNETCFDPSQTTLYAVDVDHGDFSLDELNQLIEVPHAMIYKTFSYEENGNRRYRLLFIANRPPKDLNEWEHIQIALMYQFMHPYEGEEISKVKGKLDFSYGCSRLALGSVENGILFMEDQTFNVDELLLNNEFVIEQFQDLESLWKLELKRREGEEIDEEEWQTKKERTRRGRGSLSPELLLETPEQKVDRLVLELIQSLERVKKDPTITLPDSLDVIEFEYWLNHHLPFSVLFPRPSQLNCLMPEHKDEHPSAAYLTHQELQCEVMVCRGCRTTQTTYQFVTYLLSKKFGYDFFSTTTFICEILGIKIGSEWQRQAIDQIRCNLAFLKQLNQASDFKKWLVRSYLLGLYEELHVMALVKLPLQPFSSIESSQYPCFFASHRYINKELRAKGIPGHKDADKTMEKINRLVEVGLIRKIPYRELTEDARKETDKYRKTIGYYEYVSYGETITKTIRTPHINFYSIVPLSPELVMSVVQLKTNNRKQGIREGGTSWSKMASVYGEERACEILPQAKQSRSSQSKTKKTKTTKEKYIKKEQQFVHEMNQVIHQLLEQKGWFTLNELKVGINRRKFNSNQKETYMKRFFHQQEVEAKIVFNKRISKDLRSKYNIPEEIKKGTFIYHLEN